MKRFLKRLLIRVYYENIFLLTNKRKMPDFIIIGAMKSGTTSLYQYLNGHPEIICPTVKEPSYFSWKYNAGIKNYLNNFPYNKDVNNKLVFEASATYLHDFDAAKRIKRIIPNVKLIAILRDPIERAISHYSYYSNPLTIFAQNNPQSMENRDITRAFCDDISGITKSWNKKYCRFSLYGEQLKNYYDYFNSSNLLVLDFERLKNDPYKVLNEISEFLKIDSSFFMAYEQTNKKITSKKSLDLHEGKKLNIYNSQDYSIGLSNKLEDRLIGFYKEDVSQLIKLTNINFLWSKKYL